MSAWHGNVKMRTSASTVYADKVRDLVDKDSGAEVIAVFEYNYTTRKYVPSESAKEWLCKQRGQEYDSPEPEESGPFAKEFREMRELMDEMGYSKEERSRAIDSFVTRLPLKK